MNIFEIISKIDDDIVTVRKDIVKVHDNINETIDNELYKININMNKCATLDQLNNVIDGSKDQLLGVMCDMGEKMVSFNFH